MIMKKYAVTLPEEAGVCMDFNREDYRDRLRGAWYGRAVGLSFRNPGRILA